MRSKFEFYLFFRNHNMQFTPLSDENVQIYLLFYRPASDDPFQNRLVAFFDGPFCHVEMAFPEKYGMELWEKEVWGSSIYQGDTIFYKAKTYQREGYFSFAIEVTKAQCLKIKNYCRMQAEREVEFSKLAMYSAYLPVQLFNIDGTFCSKHVTMALQEGMVEEVLHLNPCLVTPSSLYRTLLLNNAKNPIVQVIPSKMMNHSTETHKSKASQSNNIICYNRDIKLIVKNNPLCDNMAKELLSTMRNHHNLNQSDEIVPSGKINMNQDTPHIQKSLSESFLQKCLLHPKFQNSKKLVIL